MVTYCSMTCKDALPSKGICTDQDDMLASETAAAQRLRADTGTPHRTEVEPNVLLLSFKAVLWGTIASTPPFLSFGSLGLCEVGSESGWRLNLPGLAFVGLACGKLLSWGQPLGVSRCVADRVRSLEPASVPRRPWRGAGRARGRFGEIEIGGRPQTSAPVSPLEPVEQV